MPKFKLVNSVMFADGVHQAGEVIELSEADAKGYLERGSIRKYVEGEEESSASATPSVEGETLREFELDDFKYKQVQTAEGVRYTQNDVEVGENVFTKNLQEFVRREEEERQASKTSADETQTAPAEANPTAPTAEQLAQDFQAAGVEGSPNVPQPN